jgi:hypothetical protein
LVHNQIVRCEQHINSHVRVVEVLGIEEFAKFLSLFWTPEIGQHLESRAELLELILPI